jgi:hypothetical protein
MTDATNGSSAKFLAYWLHIFDKLSKCERRLIKQRNKNGSEACSRTRLLTKIK